MAFLPEKRNLLIALDSNPFSLKPFAYAMRNSRPEDQIILLTLVEHKAKSLFSSANEEILKENKKNTENGFEVLSTYMKKCKELGRNCTGQVVGVESWGGPLHIAEEICKVATKQRAEIILGNAGFIPKGTLAKHSAAIVEHAVNECPCNITVFADYTNAVDHYQCHDLLMAHPVVEELIYTIGDKQLFAVNTITGEKLIIRGPNNALKIECTPMSITINDKYLAVGYYDSKVDIFDLNEPYDVDHKRVLYTVTFPTAANGVKVSPDCRTGAVTGDDANVYFFSIVEAHTNTPNNKVPYKQVDMFKNSIAQSISWDPTSRFVAFASEGDKACVVYDTVENKVIRKYNAEKAVRIVKFNHSLEAPLLVFAEDYKTVWLVDYINDFQAAIDARDPLLPCTHCQKKEFGSALITGLCFSLSGTNLYSATAEGDRPGLTEFQLNAIPSLTARCIAFIRTTLTEHRAQYKGIRNRIPRELFAVINIKTK